jgi:Protein of unknown function (DUF3187)
MRVRTGWLSAVALSITHTASADALIDRDNGPLSGLFGFPDSREGSRLEAKGDSRWELSVTASSHSTRDSDGAESLLFDGETTRIGVSWRRGITEKLELGIEIPWVLHESGNFDSFIDRWHDVFGLPDGIRDERPNDRLLFRYGDGARLLTMQQNVNGPGDVRLLGGWQLAGGTKGSSALRFSVKLPTGDSASLLGSGGADVSLGLAGDRSGLMGAERLAGFYRVNATWLGAHDVGVRRNETLVGQVSGGINYALTPHASLALQALLRSPVYESDVSPLGDLAASVTMGVRFRLPRGYSLALAVGEDIHPHSMPDVTFSMQLQRR